jgi:hypothetical protein
MVLPVKGFLDQGKFRVSLYAPFSPVPFPEESYFLMPGFVEKGKHFESVSKKDDNKFYEAERDNFRVAENPGNFTAPSC